ncbi:MAG: reductive dehalogenase [Deltaproteobacteria bacterium]|nr:reductive dehalogenase [Deltaproteobacteria bacterium]MBW2034797.1 reductive dehalogenase [Deltaproteobacteria bacterium]
MKGNRNRKIGTGEVGRFDQRNTMFNRPRDHERSSAEILEMGKKHYGVHNFKDDEGYTMLDWAFAMGSWYLERWWGFGNMVGNEGLYEWFPGRSKIAEKDRIPLGQKWDVSDPGEMTRIIKKAAIYMGASAVGICRLDRRWIYSHRFDPRTVEHTPIDDIPEGFEYAVVMVHEMDYTLIRTAPAYGEFAAGGRGYSMMAHVASSMAHFIRDLGYEAIPCGNDTTLSIPMAIDAGLGEIGRNGLLITPWFGPRVRISKVLTNLPLVPDKPIEIGVRKMCEVCGKCAKACPGQSISFDEPTTEGRTLSNNHGIYKWYINPERCFKFWVKNNGDCANCIRVCVFNKPNTWFHSFVRWHVRNLPQFDSIYLWMDNLFGYGKRMEMGDVWK